jgi:DNA-binding transcriptional MerR regulator
MSHALDYHSGMAQAQPSSAADADGGKLTIDELARATGMTVRNLRAHQDRGLLPPPDVQGRTGYYGPEHVARVRLIQEMQAAGFNLKAIKRVIDASNGAGDEALDFGRAVLSSFEQEEPEFATAAELEERLGGPFDPKTARKAERLGIVRPLGDGIFEISSPTLARAGEELVSMGVPVTHALAVAERAERHTRAIAEAFVRLFMDDVVGDARPSELSSEEWSRLRAVLDRLSPLATEVVEAAFRQTMSRMVERKVKEVLPP